MSDSQLLNRRTSGLLLREGILKRMLRLTANTI